MGFTTPACNGLLHLTPPRLSDHGQRTPSVRDLPGKYALTYGMDGYISETTSSTCLWVWQEDMEAPAPKQKVTFNTTEFPGGPPPQY